VRKDRAISAGFSAGDATKSQVPLAPRWHYRYIPGAVQPTILIVDDEKHTREGLRASLEDAFDVYVAADVAGAMNILENEHVDLVLTDLRLGGEDGMTVIEKALSRPHPPVVIMMTAYGGVDTAVEAMKRGAYDFVTKPLNIDRLEILIKRALRTTQVEKEVVELKQKVETRFGLERLIGHAPSMEEVFDTVKQVAPSRATVLITGESGTGKELVAQAIHTLSGRPKDKFVAVHMAAFSSQLLESELFGHEKGAFTGASERRIGRFEQANGGTLFLDEIGEIDKNTQVKLLRVLGEERSFERVGGNTPIKVDVRLVAATNRDLERMVSTGDFRDDLYFRLSVVRLHMPPLRERREDVALIAAHFLKVAAQENAKPVRELTADALSALEKYPWPGNVRELRAAIERAVVMANGPKITLRDLPPTVREGAAAMPAVVAGVRLPSLAKATGHFNLQDTEQRMILRALEQTGGNVTKAAKMLGMSRRTLHRRLHEMRRDDGGAPNDSSTSPPHHGV
jgi:two-component system, NtrC family, response regulator AtoC